MNLSFAGRNADIRCSKACWLKGMSPSCAYSSIGFISETKPWTKPGEGCACLKAVPALWGSAVGGGVGEWTDFESDACDHRSEQRSEHLENGLVACAAGRLDTSSNMYMTIPHRE